MRWVLCSTTLSRSWNLTVSRCTKIIWRSSWQGWSWKSPKAAVSFRASRWRKRRAIKKMATKSFSSSDTRRPNSWCWSTTCRDKYPGYSVKQLSEWSKLRKPTTSRLWIRLEPKRSSPKSRRRTSWTYRNQVFSREESKLDTSPQSFLRIDRNNSRPIWCWLMTNICSRVLTAKVVNKSRS